MTKEDLEKAKYALNECTDISAINPSCSHIKGISNDCVETIRQCLQDRIDGLNVSNSIPLEIDSDLGYIIKTQDVHSALKHVDNWFKKCNIYPCEEKRNVDLNVITSMDTLRTIISCMEYTLKQIYWYGDKTNYKALAEEMYEASKKIKVFVDEDFQDGCIFPTPAYKEAYNAMNEAIAKYEQAVKGDKE